jgi:hypothetical protein
LFALIGIAHAPCQAIDLATQKDAFPDLRPRTGYFWFWAVTMLHFLRLEIAMQKHGKQCDCIARTLLTVLQ